jgi:hypothetical protein
MQRRSLLAVSAIALVLATSSCAGVAPEPASTPQPKSTPEPTDNPLSTESPVPTDTSVPTETPMPTATPVATSTPTARPLPEALKEQILATWKPLVLIQVNVEMLAETARRVQAGELEGFESLGTILALAAMIKAADENLPQLEPMPELRETWDRMLAVHERSKGILADWYNEEVDSGQVIRRTEPLLAEAESALSSAERTLAREYGLPTEELKAVRQELLQEMRELMAGTVTPAP